MKSVVPALVLGVVSLSACGESGGDGPASAPETVAPALHESSLPAGSLEELVSLAEEAGLSCDSTRETTYDTHDLHVCDNNILLAHFHEATAMQVYVDGYREKEQTVVVGANWFMSGPPARVEPIAPQLATS